LKDTRYDEKSFLYGLIYDSVKYYRNAGGKKAGKRECQIMTSVKALEQSVVWQQQIKPKQKLHRNA
jgi:hypothetical protein